VSLAARPSADGRTLERASFAALGSHFEVATDIAGLGEVVDRLFGPWAAGGPSGGPAYELLARGADGVPELLCDGVSIQRGNGPGSMLTWVIADVGSRALTEARGHITVHAGVVARDGVAVMLPAPPDHGKTTTTIGLVEAGFAFLSDESAPIGLDDGLVHPFLRPLMLAPDAMALFPRLRASLPGWADKIRNLNYLIPASDLRPGSRGEPCPVGFVVAPRFERGSATSLEPVPRAEMLTLLLEQTFNLRSLGTVAVERLAGTLRDAECYLLTIGDLADAVEVIDGLTR
jgi:hypothetical protein